MNTDRQPLDDAALIAASLREPDAFGALFDRHYATIYRYLARRCGADGADDLAGEVFRVAFERRRSFDLAQSSARPWLYGIATNVLRNHRRAELRRLRALQRAAAEVAVAGSPLDALGGVDERIDANARRSALLGALATLSEGDRDALVLVGVEGLSYQDVAAALGVPIGTVRSRLHRSRGALRELLSSPGQEQVDRPTMEVRHER